MFLRKRRERKKETPAFVSVNTSSLIFFQRNANFHSISFFQSPSKRKKIDDKSRTKSKEKKKESVKNKKKDKDKDNKGRGKNSNEDKRKKSEDDTCSCVSCA